jgi:acyl-coenzyme A thioesterase PaaI-like protein
MKLSLSEEYGTPLPFIDHLGIERVHDHAGRALLALQVKPAFRNSWRAALGGVIMTMLAAGESWQAPLAGKTVLDVGQLNTTKYR